MQLSPHQVATLLQLENASSLPNEPFLTGFAGLNEAEPSDISFLGNPKYLRAAEKSLAGLILANRKFSALHPERTIILRVENPSLAFAKLIQQFHIPAPAQPVGIDPAAIVHREATVASTASIGPGVVVGSGARIGEHTIVHPNVVIGPLAEIGENCLIHANASIRERVTLGNRVIVHCGAVIGSDGFGFEPKDGRHVKIEQVGTVVVEDDVEIGANTTIDRARFGRTWIKEGTKMDNLVQIGHNVVIGRHCILVAAAAISGSTVLGDYVTFGGQVGCAGHLRIGDGASVGAQSGISKNIPAGETWFGSPATPMSKTRRTLGYLSMLDRLFDRVKKLEDAAKGDGSAK